MTYDSALHFYTLRPEQAHPHLLVVPDTEDPYCPAPQALLAPLGAVRAMVRTLLPGPWLRVQGLGLEAGLLRACIAGTALTVCGPQHVSVASQPRKRA